jgi:hypothetical protein
MVCFGRNLESVKMEKLLSELIRLYLPPATAMAPPLTEAALAQRAAGGNAPAISLATPDGMARALAIRFAPQRGQEEGAHWTRLCDTANALQAELGFPAPAVSVCGDGGYGLWLSLAAPVPVAQLHTLLALLQQAYFPDFPQAAGAVTAPVNLPPCFHAGSGLWSAFIHPGMGASFADGSGLEIAPPAAGQAAFLESLHSITAGELAAAFGKLGSAPQPAPVQVPVAPAAAPEGLLLKDATLEDIVRHLHAKNIEPTFRFLK